MRKNQHRCLAVESLENRLLLTSGLKQLPLPTKIGQQIVIDDWDNDVTQMHFDLNYSGGNNNPLGDTNLELVDDSSGSFGNSLKITAGSQPFEGFVSLLFGREEVKGEKVPGLFLDTRDIFGGSGPLAGRDVEELRFDIKHDKGTDLVLTIELQDEAGVNVSKALTIPDTGGTWDTKRAKVNIPSDFSNGAFDWSQLTKFTLVVSPGEHSFMIDNLRFVDTNGLYPDLAAVKKPDGTLAPSFEVSFLDYVRYTSSLYFTDFASGFAHTGGIIQDRSTFPDLLTVGGAGFQLTSYVVAAEQGYLQRNASGVDLGAAQRVRSILEHLADADLQSDDTLVQPVPADTIGHEGFFYHFLGTNGRRKNTTELSTIDTALALAGVVTAGQYFDAESPDEVRIRELANDIYERVNWDFMRFRKPNDRRNNQFYLGWKPEAALNFEFPNPKGPGFFSGSTDVPQTIDFYTDEGLLVALLAMGSPNPAHRLGREVWDAMAREGDPFVKTFPGSLFTYQFGSVWLDTAQLGADNHPTRPMNFFDNTGAAIDATRQYAIDNPNDRETWHNGRGETLWGLSAAEGPFDEYFAHGAPPAALASGLVLEAESGAGGATMFRSNASGGQTRQLGAGETLTLSFGAPVVREYLISVRYSNDNSGPLDQVAVTVDGVAIGSFAAQATGDFGNGWNVFETSPLVRPQALGAGSHQVVLSVSGGDTLVEIDQVTVSPVPPLETGTVTNYGVASSIVHRPAETVRGLWEAANLDLNGDKVPDLLHPRFGFADAYNLDIADAQIPGIGASPIPGKDVSGPWAHFVGFAIDHGPMLILIDNYLANQFVPGLFMSHPSVAQALDSLFKDDKQIVEIEAGNAFNIPLDLNSRGSVRVKLFSTKEFNVKQVDLDTVRFAGAIILKSQFTDLDKDGDVDLLFHFRIQDTNLLDLYKEELQNDLSDGWLDSVIQSVVVSLTGKTKDDQTFGGSDTLEVLHFAEVLRTLFGSLFK